MSETLNSVAGCGADVRPYLRLWIEVMRLGVQDFCYARARGSSYNHPHIQWFWSDSQEPGSYLWLCHLLDLDPAKSRSQVMRRWRKLVDKRNGRTEDDNG